MSRVIVRNLPSSITEEKVRQFFSAKGELTDVQLKYSKEGKFRKFCFIGYKTDEEAAEAIKNFNNTYLQASKITLELAVAPTCSTKNRPWSKYSKDSSAHKKLHPEEYQRPKEPEKEQETAFWENELKEIEDDPEFQEFVQVNKRGSKPIWANDAVMAETETADPESELPREKVNRRKQKALEAQEEKNTDDESELNKSGKEKPTKVQPKEVFPYTVKVRYVPKQAKKGEIRNFFRPLKIISIRRLYFQPDVLYLSFKTEEDMNTALQLDKTFFRTNRVRIAQHNIHKSDNAAKKDYKNIDIPLDTIADTGKIFARNLPYTCTEEDLQTLFKSYGPIQQLNLPIDNFTKKHKGFAFISFLFAEHAVKALNELDGTLFQGRCLHLIPGLPTKQTSIEQDLSHLSFKQRRKLEQKQHSKDPNTWNTLFLGANAVADVMTEKYGMDKADILGAEQGDVIAVRMALGETQIVQETRQFLEDNGVDIQSFSQGSTERSKTVILAKNLPANTSIKVLRKMFSAFGTLVRLVMPPAGISALIEFENQQEARKAFNKLAFSMFDDAPLYLEWAPVNVFSKPVLSAEERKKLEEDKEREAEEERRAAEEEPEPDTTVFVKNINFDTDDDALRTHFVKCGTIHHAMISRKYDQAKATLLSAGYGFVQFKRTAAAKRAIKELQHSKLDGHVLELKMSTRDAVSVTATKRKAVKQGTAGTKILVRNIPFQATQKEIEQLFSVFGTLADVRLPKKLAGSGQHRGFGFVDYTMKTDAKRAMEALSTSTHLYGKRLVLEWADIDSEDPVMLQRKTAEQFVDGSAKKKFKRSVLNQTLMGDSFSNI